MKIILESEAPQRSDRWFELHIGRPTASEFHRVITPAKLELSKQRFDFAYRLAAEQFLNQSFSRSLEGLEFVEKGKTEEPKAIQQYETINEVETYPISMILTDDKRFGCSPDRLVVGDDRHGLEIKSLFPPKMVRYHMEGSGSEHRIQVLGQMWIGEFTLNDLFCYNEDTPPYFAQWKRPDVANDIAAVAAHMDRFGDELDEMMLKLHKTGFFIRRAHAETILDVLSDSMIGEIMKRETAEDLDLWYESPVTAANLRHLDRQQRDRIGGIVNHKKVSIRLGEPMTVVGWAPPKETADDTYHRVIEEKPDLWPI